MSTDERDAALKYEFRGRRPDEGPRAYRRALIEHVSSRNYAAGHELRVGRQQADWTPEDRQAFGDLLMAPVRAGAPSGPSDHFHAPLTALQVLAADGHAVEDGTLLDAADRFLDLAETRRRAHATEQVPIIASVLLAGGRMLTAMPGSDDRKAVLKMWADSLPVFGYVLMFDAYIHRVHVAPGTETVTDATTLDALTCHIGSRTGLRQLRARPYRVVNGVARFDAADRQDIDKREARTRDPYADLFAFPAHRERA